jgi:hypothetical protein
MVCFGSFLFFLHRGGFDESCCILDDFIAAENEMIVIETSPKTGEIYY